MYNISSEDYDEVGMEMVISCFDVLWASVMLNLFITKIW